MTKWLAAAAFVVAVMVLSGLALILVGRQASVSGSSSASVRIDSATGAPGTDVSVSLEVRNVPSPGVAAVKVDIVYDPSKVTPSTYSGGPGWDLVQCNLSYASNTIRCDALEATGMTGDALVANITFHIKSDASGCSGLDVQIVKFVDKDNNPILPVTDEDGQICAQCPDADGDKVCDADDECPGTAAGADVDANGCSAVQVDADGDGVCNPGKVSTWCNGSDECPGTAAGAAVDDKGCSKAQVDQDLDGVCDPGKTSTWCTGSDSCPNTPASERPVDSKGCSQHQVDEDMDGVCDPGKTSSLCDGSDICPGTAAGAAVDDNGCPRDQVDQDLDGVCNPGKTSSLCTGSDSCPNTPASERPVDSNGCSQHQVDEDMDGKCDPGKTSSLCTRSDNCPLVANPGQEDMDHDGKGDVCDSDIDGDGFSNSDEDYYGSDPKDATSTPESLAIVGTCTDGKDNDGDGNMDAGETDGPDGDTAADCAAAPPPPPPPTPTPSPTPTPTPKPSPTPGVLPLVSIPMAASWNDKCYAGEEMAIEDALSGIEDKVLAVYILNASQAFDGWFPDKPEASTIDTLHPFDQLFVLMSEAGSWKQEQLTQTPASVNLIRGWNSICYTGETKPVEEATSGIAQAIAILYKLSDSQAWDSYIPSKPGVGNITTLTKLDSVLLLVTAEGGITWMFDP